MMLGDAGYAAGGRSFGGLSPANSWKQGSQSGLWGTVCKGTCGVQVVGGVLMAGLSTKYLFDYMATMGIVIGLVMIGVGLIGLLGAFMKNKDFLNFHIVGAILAIMLSFQFIGQVWREVEVDCALAELYIKGHAVEELTKELAHEQMFDTIYKRINEVEDMVGMVHSGVIKTFQMFDYDPDHPDSISEKAFIDAKLKVLKNHAAAALQEVMNNPEVSQDKVEQWSEDDRKALESKLAGAEKVLNRITEHETKPEERSITAKEYEELLYSVTQAFLAPAGPQQHKENPDTTDLARAHEDLEKTKNYLGRLEASVSTLEDFNKANVALGDEIRQRRNHFNSEYMNMVQKKREKQDSMRGDPLEHMPEHCVTEESGVSYMGFAGICVAIAQLASVYFTLCLLFRLPIKME
ncbi:hypothetical protein BSKO_05699 [Bryopsis sp. KO-2023]|nr:hypothetical protein BSKO_05699 [Bryopsis sp. KO-2023]